MKQRSIYTVLVLCLVLVCGLAIRPTKSEQPKQLNAVMKAKLSHAQKVLEGLAKEDFKSIRTNALALSALSQADAWHVHKTPDYVRYSNEFRRHADALAEHAKAKKLEACTLDYVQLTMICVNCHSYTRRIGVASTEVGLDGLALGSADR